MRVNEAGDDELVACIHHLDPGGVIPHFAGKSRPDP